MKEYLAYNLLPSQEENRDSSWGDDELYNESQGDYVKWANQNNQDYGSLYEIGDHAAGFEAGYEDPLDLHSDTE